MINSRNIDDLHPFVANLCRQLIQKCKEQGIIIQITSSFRDQEYQTYLYSQGRTRPGNIVTNAKLVSFHGYKLAFDICVLINGKVDWNTPLYNTVGAIGEKLGLEWGYRWRSFPEKCHFQASEGLTANELRAGKRPSFWNKTVQTTPTPQQTPTPQPQPVQRMSLELVVMRNVMCYKEPNVNSEKVKIFVPNDKLTAINIINGWYQLSIGYVLAVDIRPLIFTPAKVPTNWNNIMPKEMMVTANILPAYDIHGNIIKNFLKSQQITCTGITTSTPTTPTTFYVLNIWGMVAFVDAHYCIPR